MLDLSATYEHDAHAAEHFELWDDGKGLKVLSWRVNSNALIPPTEQRPDAATP